MFDKFREALDRLDNKKNRKGGAGAGAGAGGAPMSNSLKKGKLRDLSSEEYQKLLAQQGDDNRNQKAKRKLELSDKQVPGAELLQNKVDRLKTVSSHSRFPLHSSSFQQD